VLTASAATRKALAPPGEPYTAFTGVLADVLDRGVAGGPPLIDVSTLYREVYWRLSAQSRPLPQFGSAGHVGTIVLARNTAWTITAERAAPAGPPPYPPAPPTDTAPLHPQPPVPHALASFRTEAVDLQRSGRYGEARTLRLRAAAAGNPQAIGDLVAEYRRSGRYADADELERAAPIPGAVPHLLHRLGEITTPGT
jgi:peptide/nickel transport system substrate-binding protein